jgi:ABC-type antimicrobial peptide transport system permease subunit
MLRNSLFVSWRLLVRNKVYAVINVLGLSLGMVACLVIWLIAHHEFTFDKFHPERDRIYRVITYEQYTTDTPPQLIPAVVPPLPVAMSAGITGIEISAPYHTLGEVKVDVPGNKSATQLQTSTAILSSGAYFHVMSYDWLAGSPSSALNQPNTVVLTESKAKFYFGPQEISSLMGRELIYDDSVRVLVSGVVKDWEGNTDFPYTEFISLATADHSAWREALQLDHWKGTPRSSRALVKLHPHTPVAPVQAALDSLFKANYRTEMILRSQFQPLSEVHFTQAGESTTSTTRLSILYALMAVALFLQALAIMNYVNLSTAQSLSREKQIGIRKIIGCGKRNLMLQFLSETFLLCLLAAVIACAGVDPVLYVFQDFVPAGVHFSFLDWTTDAFLLATLLLTTLIAGLYPAWSISSSNLMRALRTTTSGSSHLGVRRMLIVAQFSISMGFIISSLLVGRQISYMLGAERGFSAEAIIEFSTDDRAHMDRVRLLQSRIEALTGVLGTARQNMPPMGVDRAYTALAYPPASTAPIEVACMKADDQFVLLYEIAVVAGRNITASDTLKEVLINESLSRLLGFHSPDEAIGQAIGVWNKPVSIVGVVADFHQADFHQAILPQIIMSIACSDIVVKLDTKGKSAGDMGSILSRVETEWKKIYPDQAFDYSFLDAELAALYKQEELISWLMNIATGITIFIACIGLFGLTLYSVERRTREIGIRKVLGASVTQVVALLGRDVLRLILVAFLVACPIAWYFIQQWLADFAYRAPVSPWIFLLGGICVAAIAGATVSTVAWRTARTNPIESLRLE